MMLFLPKNLNITKKDLIPEFDYVKSALSIGIPNTGARLIGNIGFFLEPIILTFTLKLIGYSSIYINYNYGIITGYVIPLIMTPSFFTMAISQALLPTISKDYALKKKKSVKTKIKLAISPTNSASLPVGDSVICLLAYLVPCFLELVIRKSCKDQSVDVLSFSKTVLSLSRDKSGTFFPKSFQCICF